MAGDSAGLDSVRWREVDRVADPGVFVAYLDRAAANLKAARAEVVQALRLAPGCSVLDVGSGAGEFLIELAQAVPGLRVVGIDTSQALARTGASRARAAAAAVEFTVGDAERLDFADASFDRVHCSRVLLHLDDPAAAVREMARVLAPGGRLAIWEPDFDALMIDSDDLATSTAVRRHLTAQIRNPDIGRRLNRLVLDTGLRVAELSAIARPVSALADAAAQFRLLDHLEAVVATGEVSAAAAAAWRRGLEAADSRGRLFVAPITFRVIADKN